jgi:predicted nucleic acid-binding protein
LDVAALLALGPGPLLASPVTLAELRSGVVAARDEPTKRHRERAFALVQPLPCVPIDATTGAKMGELTGQLLRDGRNPRRRTNDLWLAAQAIQHGHTLLTRNGDDFAGIPGLKLKVV